MAKDFVQMDLFEQEPVAETEDLYALAKERAKSTITIKLSPEYFEEKGLLRKAMILTKGMVGIPESGKISKVFHCEENIYAITGSLSSGIAGNIKFFGYRLIPRNNWNDEAITPITIAEHNNAPRRSPLSYTGCLLTYQKQEFVAYRPVDFVRAVG
jgi:hypothetical protein